MKILRLEIQNTGTTFRISNRLRNVNIVRRESRNINTQPGEIDDRKSEVIAFMVNAGMNATAIIFFNIYPGTTSWCLI